MEWRISVPKSQISPIERFSRRIIIEPFTGCWLWTGAVTKAGYGVFGKGGSDGGIFYVHRFSYETYIGEIGDGLEIDHLCRQRWCANPLHLEAVTRQQNAMRGNHPTAMHWRAKNGLSYSTDVLVKQKHWPNKGQRKFTPSQEEGL